MIHGIGLQQACINIANCHPHLVETLLRRQLVVMVTKGTRLSSDDVTLPVCRLVTKKSLEK